MSIVTSTLKRKKTCDMKKMSSSSIWRFLKDQLTKLLLPFGSTEIQTCLNKVELIQKDLLVSPLAKRLKPKPFKSFIKNKVSAMVSNSISKTRF